MTVQELPACSVNGRPGQDCKATEYPALAPMALTWYTAQFYSLVFLQGAMQVDAVSASVIMMLALLCGIPMFPGAAFLVELFPTRIRYTSLSLPYHLTSAWFGGFMPLTAAWLVARTGDIFSGLWYPIAVSGTCLLLSFWLMPETRGRDL